MLRSIIMLLCVALIFPPNALAVDCKNPFASMGSKFQLVEKLKCNVVTMPVIPQIVAMNVSPTSNDPFLRPGCDQTSPYFNLYFGTTVQNGKKYDEIVDYSDTLTDAHDTTVRVSRSCDGARLFLIERDPKLLILPSGSKANTNFRIYAEDGNRTLLGFALTTEDSANALTLRGPDSTVLASASKTLRNVKEGDICAEATWTVSNLLASESTATLMSYLLTLKDNSDFTCATPAPSAGSGISTAGEIAIGMVIGASIITAGVVGLVYYLKTRRPYNRVAE